MGFFKKITKAITSPIKNSISSIGMIAHGDFKGALNAHIQGTLDSDPFITGPIYSKTLGKKVKSDNSALDFEKQQLEDWKAIYGDVQDNLSAYYSNLTPEYYANRGLEAFNKERNNELADLNTYFSQANVNADAQAETLRNENINAAQSRAQIRRYAPDAVSQLQQNFLTVGMGNDPSANYANALANQDAVNNQASAAKAQATGQLVQAGTTIAGSFLQTGLSK